MSASPLTVPPHSSNKVRLSITSYDVCLGFNVSNVCPQYLLFPSLPQLHRLYTVFLSSQLLTMSTWPAPLVRPVSASPTFLSIFVTVPFYYRLENVFICNISHNFCLVTTSDNVCFITSVNVCFISSSFCLSVTSDTVCLIATSESICLIAISESACICIISCNVCLVSTSESVCLIATSQSVCPRNFSEPESLTANFSSKAVILQILATCVSPHWIAHQGEITSIRRWVEINVNWFQLPYVQRLCLGLYSWCFPARRSVIKNSLSRVGAISKRVMVIAIDLSYQALKLTFYIRISCQLVEGQR